MAGSDLIIGLETSADNTPDKTAVQDYAGRVLSFSELVQLANCAATGLRSNGVRHGDRVAIVSRNSVDAIILFWGILRAGAVAVWLDEQKPGAQLDSILENCSPRLLLTGTTEPPGTASSLSMIPIEQFLSETATADQTISERVQEGDLATIVYTSGSSGQPKGVCLTHRNLAAVARAVIQHMPIRSDDSYLMLVPLHYVHGLLQLLVHMLAGAPIHLSTTFQFPRLVTQQIRDSAVTGFSGVPFHFNALISRGGLLQTELPRLRWVTSTGGALQPGIIEKFVNALPHVEFHIAYGQTECAPRATALHPSKILKKPTSVGSPIPGVQVHVTGSDGKPLPHGETGEIVISGPNVMPGYWNDPEATAAAVDAQGRLHTGDLGHFDEDGDLFLDGRLSELIKTSGERVSAVEVEQILMRHAEVLDVVATGANDEIYGELLVANVLICAEMDTEHMEQLAGELHRLAVSESSVARSPRLYQFWREFPTLRNGKTDRLAIREANASKNDRSSLTPVHRVRPWRDTTA